MLSDTHRRLREATHADHRRVESRLDVPSAVATLAGRRDLVGRFWRLHAEIETAAAPWLEDLPGLEFEVRRRTTVLLKDLAALGLPPPPFPRAIPAPGLGEALGLLYVVEGSTLGGRTIRCQVEAGGGDMTGLTFLDPYGESVARRWLDFLALLDRTLRTPAEVEAAVSGAVAAFRLADRRLYGEAVLG